MAHPSRRWKGMEGVGTANLPEGNNVLSATNGMLHIAKKKSRKRKKTSEE